MANPIHGKMEICRLFLPLQKLKMIPIKWTQRTLFFFDLTDILFFEASRKMADWNFSIDEPTAWNPIGDKFDELSFSDYLLSDQIDGVDQFEDLKGMLSLCSSSEQNHVGMENVILWPQVDEFDIAAVVNPYLRPISNCGDFGGSECMEWSMDPLSQNASGEPIHKRIKLCHGQQFHDTLIPSYLHEANSFEHLQNVMKKLDFGMRQCITSGLYRLAGSTIH